MKLTSKVLVLVQARVEGEHNNFRDNICGEPVEFRSERCCEGIDAIFLVVLVAARFEDLPQKWMQSGFWMIRKRRARAEEDCHHGGVGEIVAAIGINAVGHVAAAKRKVV